MVLYWKMFVLNGKIEFDRFISIRTMRFVILIFFFHFAVIEFGKIKRDIRYIYLYIDK